MSFSAVTEPRVTEACLLLLHAFVFAHFLQSSNLLRLLHCFSATESVCTEKWHKQKNSEHFSDLKPGTLSPDAVPTASLTELLMHPSLRAYSELGRLTL